MTCTLGIPWWGQCEDSVIDTANCMASSHLQIGASLPPVVMHPANASKVSTLTPNKKTAVYRVSEKKMSSAEIGPSETMAAPSTIGLKGYNVAEAICYLMLVRNGQRHHLGI